MAVRGPGWRRTALPVVASLLLALFVAGAPAAAASPPTWRWLDPVLPGVLTTLDGAAVTGMRTDPGRAVLRVRAAPGRDSVTLRVAARPDERFFGMGGRAGSFDLRGRVLVNVTADTGGHSDGPGAYSPMPFLLSASGYGLQLETAAPAVVDLTGTDAVRIVVPVANLELTVLTGPDPATVLRRHAAAIGLPPLPPAWGLGVWKSLVGGTDRVRADTDRLLADGVPLDAVWVYDMSDPRSGLGWPWPIYGPVPPGHYPDPAALVSGLHARGLRVLGYLTPFVVVGTPDFAEAAAHGFLVTGPDGTVYREPWVGSDLRAYLDFTEPRAVAWWQARLRRGLTETGFDGAMQDYGEDAPGGPSQRNLYPVLYARAVREAAQSVKPDATVFFARSGYTGAQATVTGRFTGDQTRSWDDRTGLGSVLAGMLNGSLSGWPYWGPDIGGFLDGPGARDRELWTRWVELGALSPVMRDMLGDQADPIGVDTDDGTRATFRGYALLHRALKPYLHRLAVEAHRDGMPLMRPLWLTDPGDAAAWTAADEYTLGPDLLVAPVLTAGTTTRPVFLPRGRWHEYWTGRPVSGPARVRAEAPVAHIPLYVRDGSDVVLPPPASLGLDGPGPSGP